MATEIRLDTNKVEIKTGEQFIVDVVIHTDKPINAVEGLVVFTSDILEVKQIRNGNSAVNLWIEEPYLKSSGVIDFSGITPGGFGTADSYLFSIVFEAKHAGTAPIIFKNTKALLNDGLGTEADLAFHFTTVIVETGDSNIHEENLEDLVLPESFNPIITHEPSFLKDKWFIIFTTQDKDSGISHYEIKESKFKLFSFLVPWKKVKSPYILDDQTLRSYISIRAVDNTFNIRVEEIVPENPFLWYQNVIFFVTLSVTIILFIFGIVLQKSKNKKNIKVGNNEIKNKTKIK